jgi:small nuclear ribonucleoprotein (snRNP)-like protein
MRRKILAINYVLITILAIQPTMAWSRAAKEPSHDWVLLMAARPGEKLYVGFKDGGKVNGTLYSVSETMLVLLTDNQTARFNRQDIQEIRLARRRSLKKSILVGALIGTGAGAVLGGAAAASDNGEWFDVKASQGIPIGAAVGAIFGTVIGLSIGFLPRRGVLIYKAEHE